MEPALSLGDLVAILYRPRQTMRRVLDAGRDRWVIQIVILAFVCASVSDSDFRTLGRALPGLTAVSVIAIALVALIAGSLAWLLLLALFAWIVTAVGRMIGGSGTAADVRAALAWSLVPVIWSVAYRIPVAIYKSRIVATSGTDDKQVLFSLLSHGGCAIAVIVLALQSAMIAYCLYVASNTLGEAERFSSWKGLAALTITFTIPVAVGLAAFLALRG
ncbi:MAG TPA: YIP1 family protein [Thermoanaerobaculia bacterium]|jgi:hypothetical protein|nr:YIP1 family protein [Thermoanaerobaculia bacterium]